MPRIPRTYIDEIPSPIPAGTVLCHGPSYAWRDDNGQKHLEIDRLWLQCSDARLIECGCRHIPRRHFVTRRDPLLHGFARPGPIPVPRNTLPPLPSLQDAEKPIDACAVSSP